MQEVHATHAIGTIIQGRYVVEDVLSKGEFGTTYLVKDKRDNPHCFVLKEVITQDKGRKRIPPEFVSLKRLRHSALPRIHQVFNDNTHGHIYILMDYIEGSSLGSLLSEQPEHRFPLLQVMSLIAPVMEAVIYLHDQQPPIIHQNINPSNMIVPRTGGGIVLVGFGFAQERETDTTIVLPNATGYTAPEQSSGNREFSLRTDIYALGATLYTLLTGTTPMNALYRLRKLIEKGLDPLVPVNQIIPTVPTSIARAIHRAMFVSSDDRFPTVERFWEALWLMATVPSEVQQFPNLMVVSPDEEKGESDANQVVQQTTEPRIEAMDKEKPALETNPFGQQIPEFPEWQITPLQPPPLFQKEESAANQVMQQTIEPEIETWAAEVPQSYTALAEQQVADPILAYITPLQPPPLSQKELETPTPVSLQEQIHAYPLRKKRTLLRILIALLAILLLISVGASFWFYVATSHHTGSVVPTLPSQHQVTPHITVSPNSKGTATPTSIADAYPHISQSYIGTIHDLSGNVTTNMSLTGMQQQQESISGYFAGLGWNSSITGTIDTTGHIQFILTDQTGQVPLSFDGVVRTDKNMVGTYCRAGQAGTCSDYGIWSVSPGVS